MTVIKMEERSLALGVCGRGVCEQVIFLVGDRLLVPDLDTPRDSSV